MMSVGIAYPYFPNADLHIMAKFSPNLDPWWAINPEYTNRNICPPIMATYAKGAPKPAIIWLPMNMQMYAYANPAQIRAGFTKPNLAC